MVNPKDADGRTNSVGLDQECSSGRSLLRVVLWEQSDQGLNCLLRPVCPKIQEHYGNFFDKVTCTRLPAGNMEGFNLAKS